MQKFKDITTFVAGAGTPIIGTWISFLSSVEPVLRIVSLLVGITVGCLAIRHYLKFEMIKNKGDNHDQ